MYIWDWILKIFVWVNVTEDSSDENNRVWDDTEG